MTLEADHNFQTTTSAVKPAIMARNAVMNVIIWSAGAPILVAWALLAALPIFALFMPERTILAKIVELAFLGTSFFGVFGLYLGARFIAIDSNARRAVDATIRGKGSLMIIYAAAWLTVYGLYQWFA